MKHSTNYSILESAGQNSTGFLVASAFTGISLVNITIGCATVYGAYKIYQNKDKVTSFSKNAQECATWYLSSLYNFAYSTSQYAYSGITYTYNATKSAYETVSSYLNDSPASEEEEYYDCNDGRTMEADDNNTVPTTSLSDVAERLQQNSRILAATA
ncbi:MAG: hypothetical protein HRK26_01735 [Rickettsiaceae bacterium H1]|nr:hypothetical protein [Rickettsiaceae bacterium H1]